jgi:glycosyltransferase involved in cell wall biosynthesis
VALPGPGPRVESYKASGAVVHFIETDLAQLVRQGSLWRARQDLRDLVTAVGPDLIHSHFVGATLTMHTMLGRHSPIPRVFQVPGPLHLEHVLPRTAEIRAAGLRDYWVRSCTDIRDRYLRLGLPPERVFCSVYGTDLDRYRRVEAGPLRQSLQPTPQSAVIGMVAFMYAPKRYLGQTRGLKGHEDLIDAVAMLLGHGLDVVAVFVGGAWNGCTGYQAAVERYGRQKLGDRAIFLSTRSDIPELYSTFDVAVQPSHTESLGGAMEAMLLEVPTIASDVGGLRDLVQDPATGWLVPPRSPEKLADAIHAALRDPAEACGSRPCPGTDSERREKDGRGDPGHLPYHPRQPGCAGA